MDNSQTSTFYPVKYADIDFRFIESGIPEKGTRRKRQALTADGYLVFFKYSAENRISSELCSEKLAFEIAQILEFPCAKIELAKDENDSYGILNYLFSTPETPNTHTDFIEYLNQISKNRQAFYTLNHIEKTLENLDPDLIIGFIRIMVFDALVGEQDRHEENWGITSYPDHSLAISPLYDNGDCLLREMCDPKILEQYTSGRKDFSAYIRRSSTCIYRDQKIALTSSGKKYRHLELIEELLRRHPNPTSQYLQAVQKLTDDTISNLIQKIPADMLTPQHRNLIQQYLRTRRDLLLKPTQDDIIPT